MKLLQDLNSNALDGLGFGRYSKNGAILGDVGMIAADPVTQTTLIRCLMVTIDKLVANRTMFRADPRVKCILRLLSAALLTRQQLKEQTFAPPPEYPTVLTIALPLYGSIIVEDRMLDLEPGFDR